MITVAVSQAASHFEGPLDILLTLVRRNQYPLDDVPIAEITRQYHAYLQQSREADVDLGAEFIEVTSWLVLLKSRAMLPGRPEEEAPARELERVLLDHETMRATAGVLRERMETSGLSAGRMPRERVRRTSVEAPAPEKPPAPTVPTVQDALLAARQALAVARAHAHHKSAAGESYSVEAVLKQLELRLEALEVNKGISTEAWFEALQDPSACAALLLALLELARLGRVLLGQREPLGPVLLKRIGS